MSFGKPMLICIFTCCAQLQTFTIRVTGKHIGSQYLKDEKAALLQCNSYEVEQDGKPLATFLTGNYHSGDRYSVFKLGERQYVVKKDVSFLKDEYRVINRETNERVGTFLFGAEWFGKTTGTLTTDQAYNFKQQATFQLFKPSTWKASKFQLFNQDVHIEYNGSYKQSVFNGTIDVDASGKYLEAILGLFIIDERHRINEERVP